MNNVLLIGDRRKNNEWTGPLRKEGILNEDEFMYTVNGDQAYMIESEVVNQLYSVITANKRITGTGKDNRRKAVASLVNACFDAIESRRDDEEVGVLWRTSTTAAKRTRYTAKLFSESARKPAVDYLEEHGYIAFRKGWSDPKSFRSGVVSLVIPTSKLEDLYDEVMDEDFDIVQAEGADSELIILKDSKKQLIEYADTDELVSQRDVLRNVNSLNKSHTWTYTNHDEQIVSLHPMALTLYRQFLEGSFRVFGRIKCRAQNLTRTSRRRLLIDGDETVELDFQCMMATLAYAEAGINSADLEAYELDGDAYALEGYPRATVKKAFNICFNASSFNSARQALAEDEKLESQDAAAILIGWLIKKHSVIREYFYSEAWKTLTIHESDIMMKVLDTCYHFSVPVLPLHDGLVCRLKDRTKVAEFMMLTFRARYGFIPTVGEVSDPSGRKNLLCFDYLK